MNLKCKPCNSEVEINSDSSSDLSFNDKNYISNEPMLLTQEKLDGLIKEFQLTKSKAELLASWLKEYNLLDNYCKLNKV